MSAVSSITFFLSLSLVGDPINGFPMYTDGKILPRIEIEDTIGREYDKITSYSLNFFNVHYYKFIFFCEINFLQDFLELRKTTVDKNGKIIACYL